MSIARVDFTGEVKIFSAGFSHQTTEYWLALSNHTYEGNENVAENEETRLSTSRKSVVELTCKNINRPWHEIALKIVSYVLLCPFAFVAFLVRQACRRQYEFKVTANQPSLEPGTSKIPFVLEKGGESTGAPNSQQVAAGKVDKPKLATLDSMLSMALDAQQAICTRITQEQKEFHEKLTEEQINLLKKHGVIAARNEFKIKTTEGNINLGALVVQPTSKPATVPDKRIKYLQAIRNAIKDPYLCTPETAPFGNALNRVADALIKEHETLTAFHKLLNDDSRDRHLTAFAGDVSKVVTQLPEPWDPPAFG